MRRAAFSLTELILVVILAAILAGIAVPSYVKMVEKSRVRDAESTLRMIFQAERIYRLDNQIYGRLAE
ncbi:MAG: prepilin-type N-terminal cleavage/methylation domain-containing protein, partial [Candidatus Omnitrophica bacterium]|nr:prepilin-type N-terminal cleavage/methylation domain-containing protein [Candidatus Omnitrophota bacterium]